MPTVLRIDGMTISFPADRFVILSKAIAEQLQEVKIRLKGFALRWEVWMKISLSKELLQGIFSCHYPAKIFTLSNQNNLIA